MAQESISPGLRSVGRTHRGYRRALLLSRVVPGDPSRRCPGRRVDPDPVPRPVRQQRHGGRLPARSRDGSCAGRADRRLRVLVGNFEDRLQPAARTAHDADRSRGRLSGLDGDHDRDHLCGGGRVQRCHRLGTRPGHRMAGGNRHRQGHRRDVARAGGKRLARHDARSPVQAVGGGARRGPDLRHRAADHPGPVHRQLQRRHVQVDHQLVRRPERDRSAELVHIARIRTRDSSGDGRGASGPNARRLPHSLRRRGRRAAAAEGRHIANFPTSSSFRGRPWSWITGRPRLVDGLLVAITLAPALIGTIAVDYFHVSTPLFVAALVLVIFTAALLAGELLGLAQVASDGAVILAAYAVSVYGSSTARLWVVALFGLETLVVFITAITGMTPRRESLLTLGPPVLVAWVIGDYIRGRRAFLTELITRHRRESDALRRQAVEDERLRIARELHDVVAHNVSLMAIQAGAARVAGNVDGEAEKALQSIEVSARDTLAEMNRLLGVLRKEPGQPELSPQPGLEQIDSLLKAANDAGLEVALKTTGTQRPLPAALDLTAYRIVQEAITNALKHARASRLEVRVAYLPDSLELTIRDNGEGGSEEAVRTSTGHGLVGMRERVALFGGELEAGSSDVGGFTVRSRLPTA